MLHIFSVLLIGALTLVSFETQAQVLAVVGKEKITVDEFKKKFQDVKKQVINPPSPKKYLEDLVRFQIGIQEARKADLMSDPKVQERIRQELYKAYVEKMIGDRVSKIKVTEKEMKNYYKDNPEVRTSHILIEFKPGSSKKEIKIARNRAQEIYKEVKGSDRDFEELVRLYSDDAFSKSTGGDIGYQSRVTMVPPYYETALKMKVGEIRGPIRSRYGFHIIKLTGKRPYSEADRRKIRAAVYDEKRAKLFDKLFSQLKDKYKIKINDKELKKLQ